MLTSRLHHRFILLQHQTEKNFLSRGIVWGGVAQHRGKIMPPHAEIARFLRKESQGQQKLFILREEVDMTNIDFLSYRHDIYFLQLAAVHARGFRFFVGTLLTCEDVEIVSDLGDAHAT